jgi:DNA-directed RNA polymerase specialized sigma24 family protein
MGAKQSAEAKRALKLVTKGLTPDEAGRRCGIQGSTVRRAMRRAGMKVKKPGRPKGDSS